MAKKIYSLDMEQDADLIKIYDKTLPMFCALTDMYNYLRNEIKYKDRPDAEANTFVEIRKEFIDILAEHEINLF